MPHYYLYVPGPAERGTLNQRDLYLTGMPSFSGSSDSPPGSLPEECVICFEHLGPKSSYRQLRCKHIFHQQCIDDWLCKRDASCPLCRETFYHLRGPRIFYSQSSLPASRSETGSGLGSAHPETHYLRTALDCVRSWRKRKRREESNTTTATTNT